MNKEKIRIRKAIAMASGMPRYIRKGKCIQCGACCQNENCEFLKFDGKKWQCLIHSNSNRPQRCKSFPQVPPIIFKTCGYYFLDKWNNNKIIKPGEI